MAEASSWRRSGAVTVAASLLWLGCGADEEPRRGDDSPGGNAAGITVQFGSDVAADAEVLDDAAGIVSERLAGLELDGADVRRDGDTIVVELDDPDDVDMVVEVVETPGELRFRPVLRQLPPPDAGSEGIGPTEPADDEPAAPVTLAAADGTLYELGPAEATGRVVESAEATLEVGLWQVRLTLREGAEGIDLFNGVAAACFAGDATCPARQIAIVVDSEVHSAPRVQQPSFERDQISINGAFERGEAEGLALVLRTGSLPVRLQRQDSEAPEAEGE